MAAMDYFTLSQFLYNEAALLDAHEWDGWGKLFASEGIYWLPAARGQTDLAVAELREAVIIQDGLAYIEPPAWFYPVRQNLGAVLVEAGRYAEAEAEYREDLVQYPNNGWSLFGLATTLEAQAQPDAAAEIWQRFDAAWELADVRLKSSRF